MSRGYPHPHSASTPNQSPPPPGRIADASAGQEDRTDPAAAAAARPKKDLFVFHVPNDMAGGELHKLFSQYGKLRRARILIRLMAKRDQKDMALSRSSVLATQLLRFIASMAIR